jgi:RimJ/RimL family protein N-acetyltransferase
MDIKFHRIKMVDFDDFFAMKCDEENIYRSGYKSKPVREKLQHWLEEQLINPRRFMFLIRSDDDRHTAIGYLTIDIVGLNDEQAETSAGVNPEFRGMGLGQRVNQFAVEYCTTEVPSVREMVGWISCENPKAIRNVASIGYVDSKERKLAPFHGEQPSEQIMEKWILPIQRQVRRTDTLRSFKI